MGYANNNSINIDPLIPLREHVEKCLNIVTKNNILNNNNILDNNILNNNILNNNNNNNLYY